MSLTVIGDVHGQYDRYVRMARKRDYTLQIGDLGFRYECLNDLDPERHRVLGGNHDNYDKVHDWPHFLGDYGMATLGGVNFFFYRGANSIDRQYRTIGVDWWEQEQLKIDDFMKARELYRETKPDIVITHDCPELVTPMLLRPGSHVYQNLTGWGLGELFQTHQPKRWLFGHYHLSWRKVIGDTEFICLDELEPFDIG